MCCCVRCSSGFDVSHFHWPWVMLFKMENVSTTVCEQLCSVVLFWYMKCSILLFRFCCAGLHLSFVKQEKTESRVKVWFPSSLSLILLVFSWFCFGRFLRFLLWIVIIGDWLINAHIFSYIKRTTWFIKIQNMLFDFRTDSPSSKMFKIQ